MADDTISRSELAQLRAQLAAQDARLTMQEADLATFRAQAARPRRPPRRILPLALVALLVLLTPLGLLAATPFTDLQPGSVHNANIDAIYNAGITTGCVPNAQYCPTDLVTRQEMASFLARTAGLGTNPPVANAKTAQTAGNATTVGGYAAGDLIHATRAIGPTADITLTTTFQTVATIAITTQKGGLVVVNGAAQFTDNAKITPVEVRLRDITSTGGNASPILSATLLNDPTATGGAGSASPTFLFNSGSLGTRTYVLEARITASASVGSVAKAPQGRTVLTAIFTPFDATGAPTP